MKISYLLFVFLIASSCCSNKTKSESEKNIDNTAKNRNATFEVIHSSSYGGKNDFNYLVAENTIDLNEELDAISDETERYKRLVEINVEEQCLNVIKTAVLQRHYLNSGFPIVHGWVFDIKSGKLIDLQINFEQKLKQIQKIYNLGGK